MLTLGFIATVPDLPDDARQAVLFAREAGAEKPFGAVAVIGLRQPFNQPTGSIKKVRMIDGYRLL